MFQLRKISLCIIALFSLAITPAYGNGKTMTTNKYLSAGASGALMCGGLFLLMQSHRIKTTSKIPNWSLVIVGGICSVVGAGGMLLSALKTEK